MAEIQFARGIKETVVPDIKVTRGRDGKSGTATFIFQSPDAFNGDTALPAIEGMFMVDEEGEIKTLEVKGVFVDGIATRLKAILYMRSSEEWNRFIRFMERYGEENGLGLQKSEESQEPEATPTPEVTPTPKPTPKPETATTGNPIINFIKRIFNISN